MLVQFFTLFNNYNIKGSYKITLKKVIIMVLMSFIKVINNNLNFRTT